MFSFFGATVIQWPWCSRISNPSFSTYHFADFFASDTTRAIVVRRIMNVRTPRRPINPPGSCGSLMSSPSNGGTHGRIPPSRSREVARGGAPGPGRTEPRGGRRVRFGRSGRGTRALRYRRPGRGPSQAGRNSAPREGRRPHYDPAADATGIAGRGHGPSAGPERGARRLDFVEALVRSGRALARAHETGETSGPNSIPGGRAPGAHRDVRGPRETAQRNPEPGRRRGARD